MTKNRFDTGKFAATRRQFLGGSLGLGAASIVGFGAATMPAARAQARRGGTLRMAYPNPVDKIDPHATLSVAGQQLANSIFDNLTDLDAKGTLTPRLATEWTPEKGGEEWVFKLREGVKFHHGKEFTSEDVVATVEHTMDKAVAGPSLGTFGPIKEVKAEGPHQVRFILTQRFGQLPTAFASRWARIVPADRVGKMADGPVGTGPFLFKDHQPGATTTVVRNENYWMKDKPYLDGIQYMQLAESVAQQAALRGGSVDVVNQISSEAYFSLRNIDGIVAYSEPTARYQILFLQANMAPFDNVKLRQAFRFIIDRKALLQSALLGQGVIGNDTPLLPTDPMYPADLPQNDQDLAKAQAMLKEAGVENLALTAWTTSERPPAPKMLLALQEPAARLGIKIDIRDVPFTEYSANVARKQSMYTTQWTGYYTDYERLYKSFHSKGGSNYSAVETAPGLDALLEDIIAEVDDAKRKELMAKALPLIHSSSDRIIPYFQNFFGATVNKLKGYTPPQSDLIDVRELWFEA